MYSGTKLNKTPEQPTAMKTLFTLALAAFVSFSAATASATAPEDSAAPAQGLTAFAHNTFMSTTRPGHLNVIIQKNEAAPVQVRIYDASGAELYRTSIKENAVLKPMNVTNLEAGTYTVELRRGTQVERDSFEVK